MVTGARQRIAIVLALSCCLLAGCGSGPDVPKADLETRKVAPAKDPMADFEEQEQKRQQDERDRLQAQVDGERMLRGQPPAGN